MKYIIYLLVCSIICKLLWCIRIIHKVIVFLNLFWAYICCFMLSFGLLYSTLANRKKKSPINRGLFVCQLENKNFHHLFICQIEKKLHPFSLLKKTLNGQWLFICFIINLSIKLKKKLHFSENTCSSHTYHIVCSQFQISLLSSIFLISTCKNMDSFTLFNLCNFQ